MGISRIKNRVVYLFLALFVSMQIAGLHVLAHIDNDDDHGIAHCVVCDYTIAGNQTPILSPEIVQFDTAQVVFATKKEAVGEFYFAYSDTGVPHHLFCRPPPTRL